MEKIAVKHNALETVNYVKNISQFYISYTKAYELLDGKSKKNRNHPQENVKQDETPDGKGIVTSETSDKGKTDKKEGDQKRKK